MKNSRFSGLSTAALILIKIILITFTPQMSESVAVISIDLGSEFMKIGIVKPGMPMEIVLNKESRRKTPLAVSLRGIEREFGNLALSQQVKKPKTAYVYLTTILAKSLDSPAVRAYKKKYPYYDIKENPETKTIYFQHDEKTTYTPEELLAMVLDHAKELANDYGEQNVDAAVIAVPAYFNQAERKAIMQAAELANLRVLQLINSNSAAGLNYGVFRRKDFNTTGTTLMFYDMGATGTTATIATFHTIKHKDDYETNPQLVIRGVGFDQTLGGNAFAERLAKHFAKSFLEKTKKDIFTNPKSIVKIYKEADRVKNVLSANADHTAQIEGLMDDVDFKLKVTRKEFEAMCADLFERVKNPVNDAIKLAEIIPEEVKSVILVGGSTRIPRVQDELMKVAQKTELGKNLNTDEAPALGAVYQAAFQSKGYKVLKFYIKDMNLYPIVVDFERHSDPESNPADASYIRRTLFDKTNQFPQKKVMTFNKHTDNFHFKVNYGDLSYLNQDSYERMGSLKISQVEVKGVKEIFEKHENEESKGIKVHFKIDDNGILNIEKIDISFEKDGGNSDESTLSKLGNKISSFFGGASEEGEAKNDEEEESKDSSANKTSTESEKPKAILNSTQTETLNSTVAKNVTTIVREDIKYTQIVFDYNDLDKKAITAAKKKLDSIKEKERETKRKAQAVNNLESFLFDSKDKLAQDDFISCSTEEERVAISAKLTEVTDWLDEADFNTETTEYIDKLALLKKATKSVTYRLKERKNRPKKLDELNEVLNKSLKFLDSIKNVTGGEDQPVSPAQFSSLEKIINSTEDWQVKLIDEQSKLKDYEEPKLTSVDVSDKIDALKREVSYLVTKIKYFRPPTKKTPLKNDEEKAKTAKKETESDDEKKTDTGDDNKETKKAEEKAENPSSTDKPADTKEETTPEPEIPRTQSPEL